MYRYDLDTRTARICASLADAGFPISATVRESANVTDLALLEDRVGKIIRCVPNPTHHDHTALSTMIAEGDFTAAFIIYTEESEPPLEGPIPTYPLSRLDELVKSLVKESRSK